MVKCSTCDFENPDDNTYCIRCGSKIIKHEKTSADVKTLEVSIILAIFLPGISYFYLKQWRRGILFFLVFPIMLFNFAFIAGFYTMTYTLDVFIITVLLIISFSVLYLVQIYDVVKITKLINRGVIEI